MTASAKSVRGSVKSIDYLREEGKGYELERNNLYGDTSKEIMQSFRNQQMGNSTCENKFFTAYISPHPQDGKTLSDKDLKEISHDFMKGIGVNPEKQAFLSVVHTEKEHKHIHLIINRIDEKGKAIKDHHSVLKAQSAAHKIATERGLISAKDLMRANSSRKIENQKEIKLKISKTHEDIMKMKPDSLSKYQQYMKSLGNYEVKPTINKAGKIQGFRIKDIKSGQEFKMSEVNRLMSQQAQKLKFDLTTENSNKIFQAHKQVMQLKPQSIGKYKEYMSSLGYDVNIMRNKVGKIQNIAFNHMNKEMGKLGITFLKAFTSVKEKLSPEELNKKIQNMKVSSDLMDIQLRDLMTKQIEELEKVNELGKTKSQDRGIN